MVHLLDTCTSTRAVNEVVGPMTGSSSRREISYSKVETSAVNVRTCMDAYAASSKPGLVRRLASHVAYLRTFVHTTLYGSTFESTFVLSYKVRKYFRKYFVLSYESTKVLPYFHNALQMIQYYIYRSTRKNYKCTYNLYVYCLLHVQ